MEEIWKDIPDYEGLYQVSNYGNVKSLSRKRLINDKFRYTTKEKMLLQYNDNRGYYRVKLYSNSNKKNYQIHQLVCMAFLNHIPSGNRLVVDHIDNNKLNNRLDNLQIISNRENSSKDKKGKTSKYVGVSFHKRKNKYQSRIQINNKEIPLGYFEIEYDAHIAYQKALNMYQASDFSFIKNK
jgi:hypothetical protein